MKRERSIIFSTDDIRAIRKERKTQFVELVKPQPDTRVVEIKRRGYQRGLQTHMYPGSLAEFTQQVWKYNVGDKLWVKENFRHYGNEFCGDGSSYALVLYYDGPDDGDGAQSRTIPLADPPSRNQWEKAQSAKQMPRWASRHTLEIERVRVERAKKPGSDIAGRSYDAGAWVWVVDFCIVEQ